MEYNPDYITRNGAPCINVSGLTRTKTENGIDYVQVQMLPIYPQRIEWVRADNLRAAA